MYRICSRLEFKALVCLKELGSHWRTFINHKLQRIVPSNDIVFLGGRNPLMIHGLKDSRPADLGKSFSDQEIISTANGFLLLSHSADDTLNAFNPMTNTKLSLPPLRELPGVVGFKSDRLGMEYEVYLTDKVQSPEGFLVSQEYMRKVYLTKFAICKHDAFISFMILSGFNVKDLSFCSCNGLDFGDGKWKPFRNDELRWITDVVSDGSCFFINTILGFYLLDANCVSLTKLTGNPRTKNMFCLNAPRFIVKVSSEWTMVIRINSNFQLYKLDADKPEWTRTYNIGRFNIFMDSNAALAATWPNFKNKIIFSDSADVIWQYDINTSLITEFTILNKGRISPISFFKPCFD